MKKLFLFFLLSNISFLSFAQTSANKFMIGGSLSINTISSDHDGSSSGINLNIAPKIGYFIVDNIAIGSQLSYVKYSKEDPAIMIGPFIRYYITTLGPNTKLFSQASAELANSSGSDYTSLGLDAGIAYFVNESIAAEVALQYKNNVTFKYSMYSMNVGLQFHFGGK